MDIIGEEIVPLDWLIRYYREEIFSPQTADDEMNQGHEPLVRKSSVRLSYEFPPETVRSFPGMK